MRPLLAVLLLLFAAGLAPPLRAAGITVTDDEGRTLTLARTPERIISMAPGATEMLFAAGAGRKVIATVEYSDEPPEARQVPRIGDANAIDVERLVALKPDVVVIWARGGNVAQVRKLEQLGIPLYRQQADSFAQMPDSLRRLGRLTGTEAIASEAAARIERRLAQLANRYRGQETVDVLLEVWSRPMYTVGGSHMMTDALRLCGARNVFADLPEAGPAIDIEAVIARDPDLIIAVAPTGEAQRWLAEWKRFGSLRAVRSGRLIPFEDSRLSRLGPSAIAATEALCQAIDAARDG